MISRIDHQKVYYAGSTPPEDFEVVFSWTNENSFDSNHGFLFMMWISLLIIPTIVLGIIWISMKQVSDEIKRQQFKQPEKTDKLDKFEKMD